MAKTYLFWEPLSDNILQERDEGGVLIAEYTAEAGLYGAVITQNQQGVDSQLHCDVVGSTLAITDTGQTVIHNRAYSVFGESVERTTQAKVPFAFLGRQGYYEDGLTAHICARLRQYESANSRWLSIDRFAFEDGINLYTVLGNSPLRYLDPSGGIKVTTTKQTHNLKCNESVPEAHFRFDLEYKGGAPCRGYIIQHVVVQCAREVACPSCTNCDVKDTDLESYEYWEAWIVKKGATSVKDMAGGIPTWSKSCGKYSQKGTIKFYCAIKNSDPRPANKRTGTGTLEKKWVKRDFGTKKTCSTTTISLPGTSDPTLVPFWGADPVEDVAHRSIDITWNCCGDAKDITFTVDPKET